MAQEGQKRYRILPAGYQAAKKLQNKSDSVENQVYKIHPQAMEYLNIVAGSIAMTDYRTTGKVTDNNWNIVGSFFGVGSGNVGVVVNMIIVSMIIVSCHMISCVSSVWIGMY